MTRAQGPDERDREGGRVPYLRLVWRLLRRSRSPSSFRPFRPGRVLVLLVFLPTFLLVQLGHWLALLLDEILFPEYRSVEVREPLFVVGMPRSGTSHLQRVLARDEERFTTLRLWELLLAPSIVQRRLWNGIIAVDRRLGRPGSRLLSSLLRIAFAFLDEVHLVDPSEPEEDYLFLLPAFACFLLVVPFPEHPAIWNLTRFDELPEDERRDVMALYRSCVQRHLFCQGRRGVRLLSKNPSFTPMIRSLSETFDDSRFIVCVRDPRIAVPSLLSALADGASAFGWDPAQPPFRDRFVDMMERFVSHALACADDLPPDRIAFAPLPRSRADLEGLVEEIYGGFGWSVDGGAEPGADGFRARLAREAERSRMHRSGHGYSLERFGLDAEDLARRFAPLLDRFDLVPEGGGE